MALIYGDPVNEHSSVPTRRIRSFCSLAMIKGPAALATIHCSGAAEATGFSVIQETTCWMVITKTMSYSAVLAMM